MLSLQQILTLYPSKLHDQKKWILREYLQHRILNTIFQHRLSEKLCFIGWTALRISYNSNRFSEDLDFDNWWLTEWEFETLTQAIHKDLLSEWYEVEIKLIYKWAFHCNIKIPQLLYENQLSPMATEKLLIKIDTTPQWYNYQKNVVTINKFGYLTLLPSATIDVLLSMKFSAFFNRVKWRDLYDIVFLLWLQAKPNWWILEHLTGIKKADELKKKLLQRSSEVNLVELNNDVAPFLFDSNSLAVKAFPQIIEQTNFEL